jgi:hypothetical protein
MLQVAYWPPHHPEAADASLPCPRMVKGMAEKTRTSDSPPTTKPVATRLPAELHWQFKIACLRAGVSMQEGFAQALREWVDRHDS